MLKTQLTPEQSAKLIELGVSPERASKRNSSVAYGNGARGIMKVPETPIFTLTDLVSPLPKKITFGQRTNCRLKLQPIVSSKDRISEVWQACYLHTSLKANAEAPELIDALYSLLVWCLEKGYVK